jgi:Ca-activated chloride channel family protein
MIEFQWPWVFAFLPLPLLVYFLFKPARHQESALHVPFFKVAAGFESADQASGG